MAERSFFHSSFAPQIRYIHILNPPNINHRRHIERTIPISIHHRLTNYDANLPQLNHSRTTHNTIWTSSQNLLNQTQNVPCYYYNQLTVQNGMTMVYPPLEANSRVVLKRKAPTPQVYYHENFYGYQRFTGSSFIIPAIQNHSQLKPLPIDSGPLHLLPVASEVYHRNVRFRLNNAPPLAVLKPAWHCPSITPMQFLHPSDFGGQYHCICLPGIYFQRNHSSTCHYDYLMSPSASRIYNVGGAAEHSSYTWINSDNNRSWNARAPNPQENWTGPTGYYDQRQVALTNGTSSHVAPAGPIASPRITHSTNLRSITTNRASRNFNGNFPAFSPGNVQQLELTSQNLSMDDDISPFANELDLNDEDSEMRLDIDNMSYEDLLMLEEEIGSVNGGLSRDLLSDCITEKWKCSSASDDDQDESVCPICLEGFKDGDMQGALRCNHVYHVACIKQWLGINRTCPLCKATALDDDDDDDDDDHK